MATITRSLRPSAALRLVARHHLPTALATRSFAVESCTRPTRQQQARRTAPTTAAHLLAPPAARGLHSSRRSLKRAHGQEGIPDEAPTTDFGRMDVLGNTPVPSTSVDVCMSEGFKLDNGITVTDGSGIILVGGEAFAWRPWGAAKKLVNAKGQWEVPGEAFNLLGLLWPRPDLLILGLGPEIRPVSPAVRKHLSSLGLRIEILDTRNAASQFNMLATERGVDQVAAAIIPIGWKEGVGAVW